VAVDYRLATIAAIYKERWQIELFFKAIKQSLLVKSQLWTAVEKCIDYFVSAPNFRYQHQ